MIASVSGGLRISGLCGLLVAVAALASADDAPSAVGSVMRLLKSGKVPEARLPAIVEIVGARGNEHDLGYLFDQVAEGKWSAELQHKALQLLVDAAQNRKVLPQSDLAPLAPIVADSSASPELRLLALRLAATARVAGVADGAAQLARDESAPLKLRAAALDALASIAPDKSRTAIADLSADAQPFAVRSAAAAALAGIDLDAAALEAARLLAAAGEHDDPAPVLDAFLARRDGSDRLAASLERQPPAPDTAKRILRHMYSIGRSDEGLSGVLGNIAGINTEPEPLTVEQMAALVQEIREKGDAARGEAVFRRGDLSCMKCHAVSAAGGQVGPDLSAVGTISPVEFLATSILTPDAAIKEAYITRVIATVEGEVLQGLVVDRTAERLVLKDATGAVHSIAIADIEQEVEGKSLMPKGLVKFMTHGEFVDLVKFLSLLGRPGDFAIRTTPRFQRYRVFPQPPASLTEAVPNDEQFETSVARQTSWVPLYARVNGLVPLAEAVQLAGNPVVYLYAEFEVTKAGPVGIRLNSVQGVTAWLDDDSLSLATQVTIEPTEGRHRLTLRVDTREAATTNLSVELEKVPASPAEFRPVDGA